MEDAPPPADAPVLFPAAAPGPLPDDALVTPDTFPVALPATEDAALPAAAPLRDALPGMPDPDVAPPPIVLPDDAKPPEVLPAEDELSPAALPAWTELSPPVLPENISGMGISPSPSSSSERACIEVAPPAAPAAPLGKSSPATNRKESAIKLPAPSTASAAILPARSIPSIDLPGISLSTLSALLAAEFALLFAAKDAALPAPAAIPDIPAAAAVPTPAALRIAGGVLAWGCEPPVEDADTD